MKKAGQDFTQVTENGTPFENESYALATPQQTAVITMDDNKDFVADLTSRETTFCSMVANTPAEKALLFKAMNNPEKRVGDCINMTIEAKDLYCEVVTCTNQQTGQSDECPRIVIIDKDGTGYQAVSLGVYSAIKKIIQVFGAPTWEEPLPLVVKQITKGDRKLLTFDVDFK
jgi:hypothetical protein|nr:MAG TPA: Single stranded DNA binding protein [Caudoviricetes sp.]